MPIGTRFAGAPRWPGSGTAGPLEKSA
jgi:hypothetical protein